MTKSQFSYSHDEEHFYGSFDTPEEADLYEQGYRKGYNSID